MFKVFYRYCSLQKRINVFLNRKNMLENTGDRTWGHLASTEHFGRPSNPSDYLLVPKEELNAPLYKESTQASHCFIYAKNNEKTFGVYHPRAAVLMQLRFDGYIGFPGGLLDKGEDAVEALNRELVEEVNLDLTKHRVTADNYMVSHYSVSKKIFLHFYALELTLPQFMQVERNAINCKDYGSEVLGTIRVPLYTMGDGYRGFPVFLSNKFIGNSLKQLLYALRSLNIMTETEIEQVLAIRNSRQSNVEIKQSPER